MSEEERTPHSLVLHGSYDYRLVALSIATAILVGYVAPHLGGRAKIATQGWTRWAMDCGAAVITNVGLWSVWVLQLRGGGSTFSAGSTAHRWSSEILVISIAIVVIVILAMIAFLRRMFYGQPDFVAAARDGESQFRMLAEAIPQIVWIAGADGQTKYINRRWYEMTGMDKGGGLGSSWAEFVHPDDITVCIEKWNECVRSGETFEIEYRLRDKAGRYRWFINRAVPLRDVSGEIQQWFGACTDIDDKMRNQQLLEAEIKERTGELFDANTKLQEEMWEKDVARKEFDAQNERMMRDLTDRSARATMLAKMGELLQSCVSQEEVVKAAVGFAPKIFTAGGAMALFNQQQALEVVSSWSNCLVPVPVFQPNACWALRTGHTHFVPAGDETARCSHAENVKHTYVCIPIVAQGETLGIVHFQGTEQFPELGESNLSLKNTFAGQIGLSIANIRLREALRNQSIMDALTGLFNRRYLEEILECEVRRAMRSDQTLGVIMLDLDHFKKFNDTYGHEAGDAVLRATGAFLKRSVRAEDIVCRFGGEEFVVILPLADAKIAQARGERIRSKLHELTVLHHGKSVGLVTVSVGIAALPKHGTSSKVLLEAADAALYRAKREGRDRVVVAELPVGAQHGNAAQEIAKV